MKKSLLLLALGITLGFSSCVTQEEPNVKSETDPTRLEIAKNLVSTKSFDVPVAEGYTTTVTYRGMVLAKTSTEISIQIPKAASLSRSGDNELGIVYSEGATVSPYTNLWQTILFEDSKGDGNGQKSDYDYNDIIVHANYVTNGNKLTVKVQPVALGSTKNIKLGFVWTQDGQSNEEIVAQNCRTDLFGGKAGMINTSDYSNHYNQTKDITVTMNSSGVPRIYWFIVVDGNTRLNSVNADEKISLDANNRPYGFALTDVGGNGTTETENTEWIKAAPAKPDWAYMPEMQNVPADAINVDSYESWKTENSNIVIEKGQTSNMQIDGGKHNIFYVKGNLTISNYWGSGSTIIVLEGGMLTFDPEPQNVTILNYGTIKLNSNSIGNGCVFKTNKDFNTNQSFTLSGTSEMYVAGSCYAYSINLNVQSALYANSIIATNRVYQTNESLIFVAGDLNCYEFSFDSSAICYIGCKMNVTNSIYITNSGNLYIAGSIDAQQLETSSHPTINLRGGGMINIHGNTTIGNMGSVKFKVIGSAMGGLLTNTFDTNEYDARNTFLGHIGIMSVNNDAKIQKLQCNEDVIKNANDIHLPVTSCSVGYNPAQVEDKGAAWFDYPLENVNISSCYNFDEWIKGNFDMTKMSGARVFDTTNTNPSDGSGLKIFEIK